MKQLIKVDRVCSSEEAGQLEDLGINIIGVCFENSSELSDRVRLQNGRRSPIIIILEKKASDIAEAN